MYKKQIIKLMQVPQGINLRSHHSLKSSTINDGSNGQHMNPLSSRLAPSKKISINSKNQHQSKYPSQQQSTPVNKNITSYEALYDNRFQYQSNGSISKNELYITLGNKTKQINYNGGYQTHVNDSQFKMDYVMSQLQKQNRRLTLLELRSNQNWNLRQQIQGKINQIRSQPAPDFNQTKSQISLIKRQLQKLSQRKDLQPKLQTMQKMYREQSLQSLSKLKQEISSINVTIDLAIKKQNQKINQYIDKKLQQFQEQISQYLEKNKINLSNTFYEKGNFVEKLYPLFKNSTVKLKILGRVSLIEMGNRSNPENQGEQEYEEWIVEEHCSTYMIDKEGFLLDEDQNYIVNRDGSCVKLNEDQINTLMSLKILQTSEPISLINN